MYEIDLGNEVEIKVKYSGQEYSMREPTVDEVDVFREKNGENAPAANLINFVASLGMPIEVVRKMGVSKLRDLMDGLMDRMSKKKSSSST